MSFITRVCIVIAVFVSNLVFISNAFSLHHHHRQGRSRYLVRIVHHVANSVVCNWAVKYADVEENLEAKKLLDSSINRLFDIFKCYLPVLQSGM